MRMDEIRIILVLLLLVLLVNSSNAAISYDISVKAGGNGAEIRRQTQNLTLTIDGLVSGVGNFSRLTHIRGPTGISADESTSSTKKGNLSYEEKKALVTLEGPVVITASLKSSSYNYTPPQTGAPIEVSLQESADVFVDEYWPAAFANYNNIDYSGPEIRTSERYENNGDVVASSIDSWDLTRQSLYRTYINRTAISLSVTPNKVTEDLASNKSSFYVLESRSTGGLTHLEAIRGGSSCDSTSRISEDYKGQENISLVVKMNGTVIRRGPEAEWLPCGLCGFSNLRQKFPSAYSSSGLLSEQIPYSEFC
jgi:hypothetical protein